MLLDTESGARHTLALLCCRAPGLLQMPLLSLMMRDTLALLCCPAPGLPLMPLLSLMMMHSC